VLESTLVPHRIVDQLLDVASQNRSLYPLIHH
jgi:hypothetical protein